MAAEHLRRTHVFSGNRRKFTFAGWFKKNRSDESQNSYIFGLSDDGGSSFDESRLLVIGATDQLQYTATDLAVEVRTEAPMRDNGAWQHYMVAVDTTLDTSFDRVKLYVNGVRQTELAVTNMPAQNAVLAHTLRGNALVLGSYNGSANFNFRGYYFDVFNVDGLALTPDVFGIHKDGTGKMYAGTKISSGEDLKGGQWIPKKPKTIIAEIDRLGGFGNTGFYLPMNDASNIGADFHCPPNTIIKLKGEDEPQPRNGAPTTSDAFASQLRDDPYAANLALAIPGIRQTGNLVTNGSFDTNTSGWIGDSGAVITWNANGYADVNYGGGDNTFAIAQTGAVTSGKYYRLTFRVLPIIGGAYEFRVRLGGASTQWSVTTGLTSGQWNTIDTSIIQADGTTLEIGTLSGNIQDFAIDDIVLTEVEAPLDYSATIKGSGSNKSIEVSGEAGVNQHPSPYGNAIEFSGGFLNNIGGASSFPAFGTSDFTIEWWSYPDSTSGTYLGQVDFTAATGVKRIETAIQGGNLQVYTDTGSWRDTGFTPTVNQWTHYALERYNTTLTLYANGVAVWGVPNSRDYDEASTCKIGSHSSAFNGKMFDIRVYQGVSKYKGGFAIPNHLWPINFGNHVQTPSRVVTDTCKNNFATLNPDYPFTSNNVYTHGNLKAVANANGQVATANMGFASGKWYWESRIYKDEMIGIAVPTMPIGGYPGQTAGGEGISYHMGGSIYYNGTSAAYGAGWTPEKYHIIGCAVDWDLRRIFWHVDGVWANSADPAASTGGVNISGVAALENATHVLPAWRSRSNTPQEQVTVNFGQNPTFCGEDTTPGTYTDSNGVGLFKYQPPSGFLALCTKNIVPAIKDPSEYFRAVTWTGDGDNRLNVNIGWKPDLVWKKSRSSVENHSLYDVLREGGSRTMYANLTNPENTGYLNTFNADGFTNNSNVGSANASVNGDNYVAWCWKAGGGRAANTDGTIQSLVSVNQTSGLSIVRYTGTGAAASVGHGLGKTPNLIITKHINGTSSGNVNWNICTNRKPGGYFELNQTAPWNGVADRYVTAGETTNSFPGGYVHFNDSGYEYIQYNWVEVDGFSKFGIYQGNEGLDGPWVYCGFKPALIWVRWIFGGTTGGNTHTNDNFFLQDSARKSINPMNMVLRANVNNAESADNTGFNVDFTSYGFKLRNTNSELNDLNGQFFFAAWAEAPLSTANAK